jgi:hypothetical protein
LSFNPNVPQPNDDLSDSQGDLLLNFQTANTSFGRDHFAFSDLTANNGKHNQVTTPVFIDSPPTGLPPVTTTDPKAYGFQQTVPLGVLQYSRGPTNAVPTPLTSLQSPSTAIVLAPLATTNLLDFTGILRAVVDVYAADYTLPGFVAINGLKNVSTVFWNGTNFFTFAQAAIPSLVISATGNILQLKNNSATPLTTVYWTMRFVRIDT